LTCIALSLGDLIAYPAIAPIVVIVGIMVYDRIRGAGDDEGPDSENRGSR